MKVLVNGGLNLSELDGWWAEAWKPEVGWALGGDTRSDAEDAARLYSLLEREVVPEFYDRDSSGMPVRWIARIRASVSELTPLFSSNRMVRQYAEQYYAPAIRDYGARVRNGGALAKDLARWSERLRSHWHQIHLGNCDAESIPAGYRFRVPVYLGELGADSVAVELYAEDGAGQPSTRTQMLRGAELQGATNAHVYEAIVTTNRPPSDFTVRVLSFHAEAVLPAEFPLILWQY